MDNVNTGFSFETTMSTRSFESFSQSTKDYDNDKDNNNNTLIGNENNNISDHNGLLINIIIYYYPPLIVVLGIVGNLLSLAVFRCTKLRQLSTSCYLTALSLSDTGCLLPYFATWLEIVGVNVYNRQISCQLLTYLFYVCGFMSPWFVVAFTVERFVATCYPLRRAAICTVSRAQAIVLALVCIAIISYLYILFVTGIDESSSECVLKQDHLDTMNILNFLDTVATLIIPGVLITGLNVLIARAVLQIEKVRCNMIVSTTTPPIMNRRRSVALSDDEDDKLQDTTTTPIVTKPSKSTRNHFINERHRDRDRKSVRCCYQMKITKMLLLISTVFVVLNAPSYTVRLWVYFVQSRTDTDDIVLYNLQQWSQLPFNLNFAINFLLYCVSGQNFRRSLRTLFWRLVGRGNHRYGRNMSFSSTKRTITVVSNSLPMTTATNLKEIQDFGKGKSVLSHQMSDDTTIVADSV